MTNVDPNPTEGSELDFWIAQMKSDIANGQYSAAVFRGEVGCARFDTDDNVDFWVTFTRAVMLAGLVYQHHWQRLERCTSYSSLYKADIILEEAAHALRQDRKLGAEKLLDEARSHIDGSGDLGRSATAAMIEGRIRYAQRRYAEAFELHRKVDQLLEELNDAEYEQSRRNNRFHWWKAAIAGKRSEAPTLGEQIIASDSIARRTNLVKVVKITGVPALWAYDRIEHYLSV